VKRPTELEQRARSAFVSAQQSLCCVLLFLQILSAPRMNSCITPPPEYNFKGLTSKATALNILSSHNKAAQELQEGKKEEKSSFGSSKIIICLHLSLFYSLYYSRARDEKFSCAKLRPSLKKSSKSVHTQALSQLSKEFALTQRSVITAQSAG